MRDAQGRSNIPQTASEAFRINENGKGTPSGVPQPIHQRKLLLVKEEFDASSFGGGEGNRTPVRKSLTKAFYECSHLFKIPSMFRQMTG